MRGRGRFMEFSSYGGEGGWVRFMMLIIRIVVEF